MDLNKYAKSRQRGVIENHVLMKPTVPQVSFKCLNKLKYFVLGAVYYTDRKFISYELNNRT